VLQELGRGGMACVYRVRDARTGKSLALKQLLPRDDKHARERASLFEREFHTLAQLAHPRVIEVYDFGIDPAGPFYTMELLPDGDLRERSPMHWREACELAFDVCSSLALLHSRRLVHRDVSPRNVRCTQGGHAKLIDFGAMASMGTIAQAVGTPPFVAPEAAHATSLDGRADLYSLGGTLYYALTGRLAYPARTFAQLVECWAIKPAPPSAIVSGIPPQLDRLVMSLISLEAALRPRSAFEVMQRLTAIAGITREEPLSVSQAYLVTPSLVGRDDVLAKVRETLGRMQNGRGLSLLIGAPPGRGRSRVLDACVLEAKTIGCCVLRAAVSGAPTNELGAAATLAAQLLQFAPALAIEAAHSADVYHLLFEASSHTSAANDTAPPLKSFADLDRSAVTTAVAKWLLHASKSIGRAQGAQRGARRWTSRAARAVARVQRARVAGRSPVSRKRLRATTRGVQHR
jgi:tRNA A-37 threonylcarbamoyl transferase component Bud32